MRRLLPLLALASSLLAQAPAKPKPPGEDWVTLFNGRDLTGWVNVGKERWTVENGAIHGVAVSRAYGYLQTEKSYRDFHLSLQFRCEGDGNSGVFFHVGFKPGTPDVSQGLQAEVDCALGKHSGGFYGDGRQWIVWPAPENEGVVRRGEWNELLLKVEGNRYVTRLNGVLMVDFTDPAPRSFDGPIALQLHSGGQGDMRFREIHIRDLSRR